MAVETFGTCPFTGYPLAAVSKVNGEHIGFAPSDLRDRTDKGTLSHGENRAALARMLTPEEITKAWLELLVFTVETLRAKDPVRAARDEEGYRNIIRRYHHNSQYRIVAAMHHAAYEHLNATPAWLQESTMLVPNVGTDNLRLSAQTAITRLAGDVTAIPQTVNDIYIQHIA